MTTAPTTTTEPYAPTPGSVIKDTTIDASNGIITHNVTFHDCKIINFNSDIDIRDTTFNRCIFEDGVLYANDDSDKLHNITLNDCDVIHSSIIGNVWYQLTVLGVLVVNSSILDNNAYYSDINDLIVLPDNIGTVARNRVLP